MLIIFCPLSNCNHLVTATIKKKLIQANSIKSSGMRQTLDKKGRNPINEPLPLIITITFLGLKVRCSTVLS